MTGPQVVKTYPTGLNDTTQPMASQIADAGGVVELAQAIQQREYAVAHCAEDKPTIELSFKRLYLRAGEVAAVKPVIDSMQDAEHALFVFRKLWGMNNRVAVADRQYDTMRYQLREAEEAIARLNAALDNESRGVVPTFEEIIDMDFPQLNANAFRKAA